MAAKRYSGNATITVSIDESRSGFVGGRQNYHVTVLQGSKRVKMDITAPLSHGSGIAIDSPIMFDEIASTALSFATNDKEIDEDELGHMDDSGWVVSRSKPVVLRR